MCHFVFAKLLISCEVSKEYFEAVNAEDTAVAYLAALARSKEFDVSPTSVKGISKRYDVAEFEDRAVGFPYGNIDGVAGVEHRASGGYVYRASHYENTGLYESLNMPGEDLSSAFGRLSINRHVNFTVFIFSSVSDSSEVKSVIIICVRA